MAAIVQRLKVPSRSRQVLKEIRKKQTRAVDDLLRQKKGPSR